MSSYATTSSVSIYADKTVDTGNYATFHSDDLGVAQKLTVSFSTPDKFTVTDAAGVQHVIGQSGKLTNLMTRDFLVQQGSHREEQQHRNLVVLRSA